MKSLFTLFIAIASSAILAGCAANPMVNVDKKTTPIVHQKVQGGVDIAPMDSKDKLFSLDIKSQAQYDVQAQALASSVQQALTARGWKMVEPSQSKLAVAIVVEQLEQTVYNQKTASGATGGVVGGILGGILGNSVNGALLGGLAGAGIEKLVTGTSSQDIYWQMNTRVSFRTKKGVDLNEVHSTAANAPHEQGDAADIRRKSRFERLSEEIRNKQVQSKIANMSVATPTTEWSNPTVVRFQHSVNKADLQLEEALPELQQAFSRSLGGVL
jgi:hypothetical protein